MVSMEVSDEGVQSTNDDASECKRCAVHLGYWDDKYIYMFIRSGDRKAPEINRGYFARTRGIRILVDKFLKKTGAACQIVNLGAGFDTLYWQLKEQRITVANYIELDFPAVTSRKCYYIKRNKTLLNEIHNEDGEVRFSSTDMHAGNYHLVGVDLRNLSEVEQKLIQSEINTELPTLFLSECVLVYIESTFTLRLLSWISSKFPRALYINYEQVNMDDKFGSVMLNNLRARGCPLAGVDACQNLETQRHRFLDAKWDGANAWNMIQVYDAIPGCERQRIEKIEFLDEHELLMQLFQHYCISVGWKSELFADIDIT